MSRWRRAFNRIGGPDAVTWPAFWVTYAANILGHLTTAGTVSASIGVRILVVTLSQIAMFAPLILLRLTLLRTPPRPRPWIAVSGFIVAALIRGITLTWILMAIGAVDQPLWIYRIIASLQNQTLLLIIVALVVSTMRAHTRTLEELINLRTTLAATQERILTEVSGRNEEMLAQVQERLHRELTVLESAQGAESVLELQRLASDVVRPMSHELAHSLPTQLVPDSDAFGVHVTWQQAVAQMVDRAPLRPGLSAGLMALFLTTATLGVFGAQGVAVTLTVVSIVFVLSAVANRLLSLILPRLQPRLAFVAVIVTAGIIGFVSTGAGTQFLGSADLAPVFFAGGGLFITGIILLLALVSAVLRSQQTSERILMARTELLRREVIRLRQAQWLQQLQISRALHGPVQSAITSAALRVDLAVRSGQPTGTLVAEVRQELRSVVDVLNTADTDSPSLDLACARISGTWEGLCEVTMLASEPARSLIDSDPISATVVIDILTEAVSNAVRHGGATSVTIALTATADGIIDLRVEDNGSSEDVDSTSNGLGTSLLSECTMTWSRLASGTGHVLTAALPAGSHPFEAQIPSP